MPKWIGLIVAAALLAYFLLPFEACAPKGLKNKNAEQTAVAIPLVVDHDSLFGIQNNSKIGDIWFSDSVGLIGTPIKLVIQVDDDIFKKFKDQALSGAITLAEPGLTKEGDFAFEFSFTENGEDFEIIVPQVKTVPTTLSFEVVLSAINPDDSNKYFQTSLEYQFLVNQGLPAT